ncbi:MAG: hypothetical protein IJC99_07355 [Clostridia bacterium]|nr:hypothetical protein [Clostridia bacterium]
MAQITEKELSALGDLLSMEQNLCGKCQFLAKNTADQALAAEYTALAASHQQHFDELFGKLQ